MEPTASDPAVQQQYGMTVGTPERRPGQRARHAQHPRRALGRPARAIATRHPSQGALPAGSPAGVRGVPQAARRARARRRARRAVRHAIPTWRRCRCTASRSRSRIRSTRRTCARPAAADARYDIDFPARDHTLVAQLRQQGRHHLRQGGQHRIQRASPAIPGGKNEPDKVLRVDLGYQRSSWAGNPRNAYDTTRAASLGSSSGSGASVSTNLVMCSLCEETQHVVPRAGQPQLGGAASCRTRR